MLFALLIHRWSHSRKIQHETIWPNSSLAPLYDGALPSRALIIGIAATVGTAVALGVYTRRILLPLDLLVLLLLGLVVTLWVRSRYSDHVFVGLREQSGVRCDQRVLMFTSASGAINITVNRYRGVKDSYLTEVTSQPESFVRWYFGSYKYPPPYPYPRAVLTGRRQPYGLGFAHAPWTRTQGWSFADDWWEWSITFPYWAVCALCGVWLLPRAAIPITKRLTSRRRSASGRCPHCAYDLRATPERCPECGKPVVK